MVITSTLAAGSTSGDGDDWSVPALDALGVPVIQSPVVEPRHVAPGSPTTPGSARSTWRAGVAIPEFDGRIIGPTFAFKEVVDGDGDPGSDDRRRPGRPGAHRPAGPPRRAHGPAAADPQRARKRVVVVLSAYPTKRGRLGNAVGLDTPGLGDRCCSRALRDAGYRVERIPVDGDTLMDELADRLHLRPADAHRPPGRRRRRSPGRSTRTSAGSTPWPRGCRTGVESVWGPAPGEVYVHDGDRSYFPGIDLGGVLVTIQPPRGFGADPIGTYHAPDLPPPHHYLAFYQWLDRRRVGGRLGCRRHRAPRQARHAGVAAGQGAGAVGRLLPRPRARRRAAVLSVRGQRPRRGHPGQAADARRRRRPPATAADPGRPLRRPRPARAAPRHATPRVSAMDPGQAARRCATRCGSCWSSADPP